MSTAAESFEVPTQRPSHSAAACMRLLDRFMVDLTELRALIDDARPDGVPRLHDRGLADRLASALWGVFSHHRAVIDASGARYDLGSWRSAGEVIADLVNRRHPHLNPPIRYMDCYMGVLLGEDLRLESRPLHRWIFSHLRDAGCDWIYSFTPDVVTETTTADRRARHREMAGALARAYDDNASLDLYAPLPAVVAAYQEVYGRLPDGWPVC